jgi:hypothetical protein
MAVSIESRGKFGRSSATRGWLEAKYIEYVRSLPCLSGSTATQSETQELTKEEKREIGSNIIKTFRNMPDYPLDAQDHNLSKADTQEGANTVPDWAQH